MLILMIKNIKKDVFVAYNPMEISSLKYPHSLVNFVGEAICLIFSKKPSFSNFQALISEPDFLRKYIQPYNPSLASEYVINELKQYVENSEFVPEKIQPISKTAGALCKWILTAYEIATLNKPVKFLKVQFI